MLAIIFAWLNGFEWLPRKQSEVYYKMIKAAKPLDLDA